MDTTDTRLAEQLCAIEVTAWIEPDPGDKINVKGSQGVLILTPEAARATFPS